MRALLQIPAHSRASGNPALSSRASGPGSPLSRGRAEDIFCRSAVACRLTFTTNDAVYGGDISSKKLLMPRALICVLAAALALSLGVPAIAAPADQPAAAAQKRVVHKKATRSASPATGTATASCPATARPRWSRASAGEHYRPALRPALLRAGLAALLSRALERRRLRPLLRARRRSATCGPAGNRRVSARTAPPTRSSARTGPDRSMK